MGTQGASKSARTLGPVSVQNERREQHVKPDTDAGEQPRASAVKQRERGEREQQHQRQEDERAYTVRRDDAVIDL
jgi:hypothetical protein